MKISNQHCFAPKIQYFLPIFLLTICCLAAGTPLPSPPRIPIAAVLGTATPPACSNPQVYLAVGALEFAIGGQTNQIWRIDLDSGSETLIYQTPRLLSIAGSDMLLPETVQEIREHYQADTGRYPNRIFPDIESLWVFVSINHLSLSPDKHSLAWVERYTWCPGNYCYGEARIKAFHMDSGNMMIDRRAKLWVTSLAWTSDGQTLVFSEMFTEELSVDTYHIKQLDVRSGEITFIGSGAAPVLSPDGQRLVAIDQEPYMVVGLNMISLSNYNQQTVIAPLWTFISTPTWSPDGSHIAFTGRRDGESREIGMSIYTLNLQTHKIITLTSGIDVPFLNNARWSPAGNLIAGDAGADSSAWNHLIVLDSQSGQVVNDLRERRNHLSFWEWSDDGQCILFAKGYIPDTKRDIAIFHIPTGNVTILPLPEALRDGFYNGPISLSDITW